MCFGKIDFLFWTINNVVENTCYCEEMHSIYMKNNLAKGSSFFVAAALVKTDGYITVVALC